MAWLTVAVGQVTKRTAAALSAAGLVWHSLRRFGVLQEALQSQALVVLVLAECFRLVTDADQKAPIVQWQEDQHLRHLDRYPVGALYDPGLRQPPA